MFRSPSRTSAKTGVAPAWTITFAVAGQVIGVVITSSPGPTPSARSERWSAAGPVEGGVPVGADGEHGARAVAAAPQRHEDVAGLPVDPHVEDAVELVCLVHARHRRERAWRRDEEACARAAGPLAVLDLGRV